MDDGDTPFPLPFDINFIGNMDNIFCVYLEVELYCFSNCFSELSILYQIHFN